MLVSSFLVVVVLLGAAHAAVAGGWAVVTVDPMPTAPAAGTPLGVGFTILQHGVSPFTTTKATVIIDKGAGGRAEFVAKPVGAAGHHVAQVTFPSAGEWTWQIHPDWFGVQDLGTVTVVTAAASTASVSPAAVTTTREVTEPLSLALRVALGVALAALVVFAATELRNGRRHVPAWPSRASRIARRGDRPARCRERVRSAGHHSHDRHDGVPGRVERRDCDERGNRCRAGGVPRRPGDPRRAALPGEGLCGMPCEGLGAEAYLRESILFPDAYRAPTPHGGTAVMPTLPIDADELTALVAYLLEL